MHDPKTVAFEIEFPWGKKKVRFDGSPYIDRPTIATIWHVDPEVGLDDSSCWTANREVSMIRVGRAEFKKRGGEYDPNHDPLFNDWDKYRVRQFFNTHPLNALVPWRWHIWHWRIQVPLLIHFKRWRWGRCCKCGRRFTWGYSPVSYQWDSDGPQWFKSETDIAHWECERNAVQEQKAAGVDARQ